MTESTILWPELAVRWRGRLDERVEWRRVEVGGTGEEDDLQERRENFKILYMCLIYPYTEHL